MKENCQNIENINTQQILEIFRKYGIVSEKPIDLISFTNELVELSKEFDRHKVINYSR